MSFKKIFIVASFMLFSSQLAFANYAFYRQVVNTCKLYRMPVDEKKMVLTKNPDGSYHFSIEMKAKLRNDFETPMLVAFISVGQAINHQEKFAKKKLAPKNAKTENILKHYTSSRRHIVFYIETGQSTEQEEKSEVRNL